MHPAVQLAQSPRRPTRNDVALVGVLLVWSLLEALFVNHPGPVWARVAVGAAYVVPLLWRRQAPLAVLLAIGAVAAIHAFTVDAPDEGAMPFPAILVATFSVGLYVPRLALSLAGAAFPIALIVGLNWSPEWRGERLASDYAVLTFFVASAWTAGYLIRRRAEQVRAAEEAGGTRAREAVAAERGRIARELHDVVAHSVSIIALQAGAAEALVESDPATAREHIGAVRQTAHDALVEMRRLLHVLREDEPTYEPMPGLVDLEELTNTARAAGLPVQLAREDDFGDIPAGMSLAVYRLVQEALTNVRKHAGNVPTTVVVRREGSRIDVVVENAPGEDQGTGADGGGHGMIGMRERVRIYGGEFDARTEEGRFVVHASFPIEAAPS